MLIPAKRAPTSSWVIRDRSDRYIHPHQVPRPDRGWSNRVPPATGRKMHFTGTTVLRIKDGKIAEEIGLDDGVTALKQLGLIREVVWPA